ncbi:MAG TPA: kelch repeat-containing protein [Gemmatimonadales bacterium]
MPKARFGAEAATLDGVIYVVGGQTFARNGLSRVEAYDVASNTWSTVQPLPNPRFLMNGVSAIAGRLYVAGGHNGRSEPVRTLYVYNPRTNTWSSKADLPVGGGCGAQGVIDGELYVYVGCSSGSEPPHFYRYNRVTDRWTTLAPPHSDHHLGEGGAVAGKFYLVGSRSGVITEDLLEVYDPATNTWTFKASMPEPSGQVMSSAVLNGKLYVAGGVEEDGTAHAQATLRVYDPRTNTWTVKAPMPTSRSWSAAAAAGGMVFVLGGLNTNEKLLNSVIAYTP